MRRVRNLLEELPFGLGAHLKTDDKPAKKLPGDLEKDVVEAVDPEEVVTDPEECCSSQSVSGASAGEGDTPEPPIAPADLEPPQAAAEVIHGGMGGGVPVQPVQLGLVSLQKAVSSKSTCIGCKAKIPEGTYRLEYVVKVGRPHRFFHASCAHLMPPESRPRDLRVIQEHLLRPLSYLEYQVVENVEKALVEPGSSCFGGAAAAGSSASAAG